MFGKQTGTIRKGLALITGFMLILTQLALPVAALAAADLSMLPQALTITYTDAAGVPGSLMTAPGAAGETADTAVYWGQVTDPNLAWPLTVSIDPGSPLCTVNYIAPVDEYSGLAQGNAAMADGMSYVATVSVFADPEHTSWVGDYPVYLSSLPVGSIVVSYLNQADNAELYSYTLVNLPPASYTIGPDQAGMVGEGYALADGTPQSVYINADGSPVYVTFYMTPIGQDIPEGGAGDLPPEGGDTYPEGGQEDPGDWGGEEDPGDWGGEEDTPTEGGQDDPVDWGGEEDVPDPQPVIDEPIVDNTPEAPYNLNDIPGLVQSDNGGSVNLRQLPDKNSTALGKVASGTLVTLHGITEDNGWYYMNCETDQGQMDGYMVSSFARPVVVFSYADENGNPLTNGQGAGQSYQTLGDGVYTDFSDIAAGAGLDGYAYIGANPAQITVTGGAADIAYVSLMFRQAATAATVTFQYVDESGSPIADGNGNTYQEQSMENGVYGYDQLMPYAPNIPGYTVQGASAQQLTVENGAANPATVAFTYKAIPTAATVTFQYVDESGSPIADGNGNTYQEQSMENGVYGYDQLMPYAPNIPGYTVQGASAQQLTVENGAANPATIAFTYKAIPTAATVTFQYVDESGSPIADGNGNTYQEQSMENGVYGYDQLMPYAPNIPGYTVQGASAQQLTVENGAANPATIAFTYKAIPTAATVTFQYVDESGSPIADGNGNTYQEQSLENGVYGYDQLMPYAPNIPGYTVQGANAQQLTVENGAANPATVAFTYKAIPTAATVTFQYVDESGSPIADGNGNTYQEQSMENGVYGYDQLMPYAPNIPGYTVQGASAQQLTVENGAANPATIAFTYKAIPAAAAVTFLYTDDNGTPVADQEGHTQREQSLPNGTYEDLTSFIPAMPGYTFLSASAQKITVTDGVADPSSVTIAYKANPTPASVTFSFVDDKGKTLRPDVPAQLDATISDLTEYIAQIDGYTYQSASAAQIVVTKGVAEPNHVTFTYKQNATTAQVEIRYLDQIGRQIGNSEYKELTPGPHTISPTIPAGYSLSGGSPATQSVTVSPALVATPNQINFNLVSNSVRGTVLVRYLNTDGGTIVASQNQSLAPGTHTLFPDAAALPAAYEIITSISQSATVTISDQGTSTPAQVDFYCKAKQSTNYVGYAVTTGQTALRKAYDMSDGSIIATLPANTLLYINGQATVSNILWDSAKTVVGTIRAGVVQDSATRHISSQEAKAIIDEYNRLNPVNTPVPAQSTGYYITVAANVPLRTYADANSSATYLPLDTVVYVTGQQYINSVGWHMASYNGRGGYIRVDQQLRKMSSAEVERYLAGQKTNTPSTGPTVAPYDPYGPSTYGYVTSGSVNFRQTPSTNGAKLKTLQRYAFALIIGTKEVNGVTWYYINQSGTTGWVHGGYFHQLNLTELSSFLNSSEYRQGLTNNSTANNTNTNNTNNNSGSSNQSTSGNNSTGSATAGNISSVEDWNVGTWQNTGVTTQTSYAPFNPYATATPSATVSASPSASVEPEETFVIGTMIPITYEDESTETQTSTAPWGLIAAGVVLIGGAGGVYAYALNQNKKRKAAAAARAAAQRRNAMAQGDPQSPYTRRAAVVPPVSGTRKDAQQPIVPGGANQNGAPYGRTPGSGTAAQNPYASSAAKNPFSSGSITGTGDEFAPRQSNPYAAPVSQPDTGMESAGQNAYRPQGAPSGVAGQSAAPQRSNPYARPIQPAQPAQPAAPAREPDDGTAAPRRRASRMERYHAADEGGRGDTK